MIGPPEKIYTMSVDWGHGKISRLGFLRYPSLPWWHFTPSLCVPFSETTDA